MTERAFSWRLRGCLAALAALVAACTSGSASPSPSAASEGGGIRSGASGAPAAVKPYVRPCQDSVYGDLGSEWRKQALVASPIAFVGLGSAPDAPADELAPVDGRYRGIKALAVVDPGLEVTVSIAPADLGHAALLYDPSEFRDDSLYSLNDLDSAVTFQGCAKGEDPTGNDGATQFNGGFVVDGPRCVALDIESAGRGHEALVLSFGGGRCRGSG